MARRHERTLARRVALQVIYASEIAEMSPVDLESSGGILDECGAYTEYARRLAEGVDEHLDEIDDWLDEASENWRLDRMPAVDRSLLRLATFEMLYVDEVPLSVSINEAVELAKEFGGADESPRFVNGVLGRIAKYCGAQDAAADDAGDGGE